MSSLRSSSSDREAEFHRFDVDAGESGQRLDKLLSGKDGIVSREMARRLILQGAVRLNAGPAEPDARVREHDRIEFTVPPPKPLLLEPEPASLNILFEDEYLIVLDKPPGMAVHPSPGHDKSTLVHHLLSHCTNLSGIGGVLRPGIVHRLDKDTSGVLVAAKTDLAHQGLSAQFRAHSLERSYTGLVVGSPERDRGTIALPVARDTRHRMRQAVREGGRHAVTHWHVERRLGPFTLLKLVLETGRTHQIRVHLAHQNWPVLGDPLYGRGRHRGLELPEDLMAVLDGFKRQALHAMSLGFVHPITAARLYFEAPVPGDFAEIVAAVASAYAARAAS
jgi:23S rRNA pseudouridine1911/1915/1917 synthase